MKIVFITFALAISLSSLARAETSEQIDYVNLGATLIKDGYLQRARDVLEKVDVTRRNFDFGRYYTLQGILNNKLSYPRISNIYFEAALLNGQGNPSLYLYMAKNNWQLEKYAAVIANIDSAGETARAQKQMYVMKAESYKRLQKIDKSWQVLDEGIAQFPEYGPFFRQKFYYLLELGFYESAWQYAQLYLEKQKYSAKDYLAVAYTLRQNRRYEQAAGLLEEAVLKYADNHKLIELLGQVYIDQERYLAAAMVFDRASITEPVFALKAATLYLKAGDPARSLQLNRRVADQREKFRQRLGIDIFYEDYESLIAKMGALKRYNLMAEDNIAYAVGYGYFRIGDYDNAKATLKKVSDSQLFTKASYILKQIEDCHADAAACS